MVKYSRRGALGPAAAALDVPINAPSPPRLCLTVRNKLHVANTGCRRCVTHPKHPLVRHKLHVANTGCRRCVTHPKHPLVRHKLHVAYTFNVVTAGLSRSRRSRTPNTDSPKRFDFGTCLASASSSSDGSLNSPPGSWSCNCHSNTITKRCIMISSASTVKVSSSESCCSKSSLYIASLWASISSNNLSSL